MEKMLTRSQPYLFFRLKLAQTNGAYFLFLGVISMFLLFNKNLVLFGRHNFGHTFQFFALIFLSFSPLEVSLAQDICQRNEQEQGRSRKE